MKNTPVLVDDTHWAGTETALAAYIGMLVRDEERVQAGVTYASSKAEKALPYLLSLEGNIGIVAIKGPMTNRTSYWDDMDKRATYSAIREAVVQAAIDPDVDQIILDIDSGGGSVAGVADVGTLIRNIHTYVKPVTAFTDGNMMSAAYWLGAAAGKVYASKVAGVGSIGVIAMHTEMSKMLADMGIAVTVMRAGKFKALANSAEPLTDAAKAQMQAALDSTYGVFVQHVADMRGVTYNKADTTMAQGREFYGEAALSAGLVDGIETFDSLMSKLSVDKQQGISHNPQKISTGNTMTTTKKALTAQDIAALASGVIPTAATAPVTPVASNEAPVAGTPEAEAAAAAAAAAAAPAAGTPEAAAAAAAAAAAPAAAAPVATPAATAPVAADVVSFLQAQVKEKDAALLAANIEVSGLKARVTDFEASLSGLLAIAAKSTNNMRIALGGSAVDMSKQTATQVLADHAAQAEAFGKKFVAGGIAAVDASQAKKDEAAPVDALTRARLAAASPSTRK